MKPADRRRATYLHLVDLQPIEFPEVRNEHVHNGRMVIVAGVLTAIAAILAIITLVQLLALAHAAGGAL